MTNKLIGAPLVPFENLGHGEDLASIRSIDETHDVNPEVLRRPISGR